MNPDSCSLSQRLYIQYTFSVVRLKRTEVGTKSHGQPSAFLVHMHMYVSLKGTCASFTIGGRLEGANQVTSTRVIRT